MAKAKKTPSGKWRVQLYAGKDENGKRKYKSFTAMTRREAELMAAEFAASNRPDRDALSITLGEAMDKYIDSKRNIVSPSTLKGYLSIRENRLTELMDIPLSALSPELIQRAVNIEAGSLSPKTVRNVTGLLSSTLKMFAPRMRFNITLPARKKAELHIPTPEEIGAIYNIVRDTDMEIPFLLASQCGLRRSEICALTWNDVGDTYIRVNNAIVRGPDGYVVKQPKSYSGYRQVECSKMLVDRLRTLKSESSDSVCNIEPSNLTSKWLRLLEASGLPHCRFHDLRHYYASVGLLEGVPPKYMADLMGHGSTNMIDQVYQHIFADSRRAFAEKLMAHTDRLLGENDHDKNR